MQTNDETSGFDTEFVSDEENDEMFDAILREVGKAVEVRDQKPSIVNPFKLQHILYAYKTMKYLCKGTGAKVTYTLNEPYRSMGSVGVIGKCLSFSKPEMFLRVAELASNFDVYPRIDGTVQLDFTFHGLTETLE